jgi:hypothetical protein
MKSAKNYHLFKLQGNVMNTFKLSGIIVVVTMLFGSFAMGSTTINTPQQTPLNSAYNADALLNEFKEILKNPVHIFYQTFTLDIPRQEIIINQGVERPETYYIDTVNEEAQQKIRETLNYLKQYIFTFKEFSTLENVEDKIAYLKTLTGYIIGNHIKTLYFGIIVNNTTLAYVTFEMPNQTVEIDLSDPNNKSKLDSTIQELNNVNGIRPESTSTPLSFNNQINNSSCPHHPTLLQRAASYKYWILGTAGLIAASYFIKVPETTMANGIEMTSNIRLVSWIAQCFGSWFNTCKNGIIRNPKTSISTGISLPLLAAGLYVINNGTGKYYTNTYNEEEEEEEN